MEATITLHQEETQLSQLFTKRLVSLTGNDMVMPLPAMINADPVGSDIADIPRVCNKIHEDFQDTDLNALSALSLR